MKNFPDFQDIQAAAQKLEGVTVKTPLLRSQILDDRLSAAVFYKPEMLQRTGSFKFRGAYNRLSFIDREKYPGGVVACSSGNHAQGVAEAAKLYGLNATIVMPSDAPEIKTSRTRRSGAEVIFYDRDTEDRDSIAQALCEQKQAEFIHPYDDAGVIAGQGTIGLEIAEQIKPYNMTPDLFLAPCGGGGMIAGAGLALRHFHPETEIYCVEPENFDDYARSLEAGERQANKAASGSICDALLSPTPGELTFEINCTQLAGGLTVSDSEVREAMAFAFEELKLVVEPGGAVALAALLSGKFEVAEKNIVIVLSGGNWTYLNKVGLSFSS